jgi:hypothetical protein
MAWQDSTRDASSFCSEECRDYRHAIALRV